MAARTLCWLPARAEVDDEEREERPEPQVDDLEEVAGPDRRGVVADEGGPRLPAPPGPRRPRRAHVALDGALADPDAQLQELAADALGAPQAVLCGQLPDQRDGLLGHLRPLRRRGGLGPPQEAKALSVPAQQRVRLHDEECGLPTAGQARQEDEAAAIRGSEHGPRDLATEDEQLLP